jgi:choline dehydrogenase-like flavoprotein
MPKPKTIRLQCRAEQYPEPDSRITLSDQLDALGLRKACIDWHLSELERKTARRMVETVGAEFERLNLGKLELSDWMRPEIEDWRSWVKEGNHHSGATRMADDPRQGVVDRNCRVHGIENLYISSSSVFPTTGTANPTFTIIALAIRLADHLKQKL